ncbi:MAG: hypothetical protein LIP12_05040 [Clostridiales bacterium]|nr:hypothetical protein [Clostridiales bacterium]
MNIPDQIISIAVSCIISAGGVGAIIICVVKFTVSSMADALSKKYELKLNKELECYKKSVEHKIYISRTRFDTEFELYRKLSKSFTNMVKEVSQLFPGFTKDTRDDYEKYKNQYDKAVEVFIEAQDELYASAPFISEQMYTAFMEIKGLCKLQLSDFEDFRLRSDAESYRKECIIEFKDAYKRTHEINKRFDELIMLMRDYISRLDVIE